MPLGSSSATPVIRPGPTRASGCSFRRLHKRRSAVLALGSCFNCMRGTPMGCEARVYRTVLRPDPNEGKVSREGSTMKSSTRIIGVFGIVLGLALLSTQGWSAAAPETLTREAAQWWADIAAIADDSTEGRL